MVGSLGWFREEREIEAFIFIRHFRNHLFGAKSAWKAFTIQYFLVTDRYLPKQKRNATQYT